MNFKQIIAFLGISLISHGTYAQFSGTNPATLSGDATIEGSIYVGSILPAGAPAKVNISKIHSGISSSGSSFSSYTTGIKINHHIANFGNYNNITSTHWNIAASSSGLHFHNENIDRTIMIMTEKQQVGIGTAYPNATLNVKNINSTDIDSHLEGFTLLDGNQASLLLGAETNAPYGEWGIEYNEGAKGLNFWKPSGATAGHSNYDLFIRDDGKVSIGLDPTVSTTFNGNYSLYVENGILTEKVKVALKNTSDWADYVFDKDYELMPLNKVEEFVTKNHHLPGVPSAEEVKESGIDVATMDAKLLEKIEELTLYMIELKADNEALKAEMEALKNKIK